MNILIIEDDQFTREMYQVVFQKAGYNVNIAENGKIGLENACSKPYDCILLDIMLPEIDGVHVLEKIRSNEKEKKLNRVPVIILTNLGQEGVYEACQTLGVSGYIIKARLTPQEVVKKVESLLSKTHSQTNS